MGLWLFPADGDVGSPDACWSYSGFNAFRQRLARAEGLVLLEMHGFGGDRPWSEVSTSLEPFLDHPDDHGVLSAADCAGILPRLEDIIGGWRTEVADPSLERHIDDALQLVLVLRLCVARDVELVFG